MRTGSPAFGTPEYCKAAQIAGQLTRRYGIPFRSSSFTSSNAADAQAAYEAQGSTWAAISGGAHLLMHGAGWLEGGLCASFEKFIIDVEILQAMAAFLEPVKINAETISLDEIAEVGPGGHYFGTPQTIAHYRTAFYDPIVSSTRNHGSWVESGAPDATQRAHAIHLQALKEYETPPMDAAIQEALDEFVIRRKADGGAPIE
jgi:trimethylamine--corrinoid protein Co-methyltransferase